MNDKSYHFSQFKPNKEPTNRQPLVLPNLPQRQPITLPTKPQTHENHDTKRKSMAVVELLWNFIRKI